MYSTELALEVKKATSIHTVENQEKVKVFFRHST